MKTTRHFLVILFVFFCITMQAHKSYATLSNLAYDSLAGSLTCLISCLVVDYVGNSHCLRNSPIVTSLSSSEPGLKRPCVRIFADAVSRGCGVGAFIATKVISEGMYLSAQDKDTAERWSWQLGVMSGLASYKIVNMGLHGMLNCCGVNKYLPTEYDSLESSCCGGSLGAELGWQPCALPCPLI